MTYEHVSQMNWLARYSKARGMSVHQPDLLAADLCSNSGNRTISQREGLLEERLMVLDIAAI